MERDIKIFNLLIILISYNAFAGDMKKYECTYDSEGNSVDLWEESSEENTLNNAISAKRKLNFIDQEVGNKLEIEEKKPKIFHDVTNQQNNFISNVEPHVQNIGKENNHKQPRKSFKISPIKNKKEGGIGREIRKNAVYIFIADVSALPSHPERIDFRKIYDNNINDEDERLNYALLHIEIKFNKWIKDHPELMKKTIYVGEARNASNRFQRHKSHCADIKDGQEINFCESSKKVEWISYAWRQNCDVQQSTLVYGIVPKYLPVVEAFLGELFNIKDAGVTILANDWAYEIINAYRQSKMYENWAEKKKVNNRKSLDKGQFFHSPTKAAPEAEENAVYGHFFCQADDDLSFLPPRKERINFGRLYRKNQDLDEVLLHIEEKIRIWIKNDQRFYENARYIGETKNTKNRCKGHKKDISTIAASVDTKLFESKRKLAALEASWPEKADIRMSPLVWNIKNKKHRHIVEVLVAELLYARGKASSEHGTIEAYDYVQKYFSLAARKDRLKAQGLSNICENLREKARDARFYNN